MFVPGLHIDERCRELEWHVGVTATPGHALVDTGGQHVVIGGKALGQLGGHLAPWLRHQDPAHVGARRKWGWRIVKVHPLGGDPSRYRRTPVNVASARVGSGHPTSSAGGYPSQVGTSPRSEELRSGMAEAWHLGRSVSDAPKRPPRPISPKFRTGRAQLGFPAGTLGKDLGRRKSLVCPTESRLTAASAPCENPQHPQRGDVRSGSEKDPQSGLSRNRSGICYARGRGGRLVAHRPAGEMEAVDAEKLARAQELLRQTDEAGSEYGERTLK